MHFPSGCPFLVPPSWLFVCLSSLCLPNFVLAESLKITSNPQGATVELDGVRQA